MYKDGALVSLGVSLSVSTLLIVRRRYAIGKWAGDENTVVLGTKTCSCCCMYSDVS